MGGGCVFTVGDLAAQMAAVDGGRAAEWRQYRSFGSGRGEPYAGESGTKVAFSGRHITSFARALDTTGCSRTDRMAGCKEFGTAQRTRCARAFPRRSAENNDLGHAGLRSLTNGPLGLYVLARTTSSQLARSFEVEPGTKKSSR